MDRNIEQESTLTLQIDTKALKFNPRKMTQPLADLFGKSFCYICFKFHDLKTDRKAVIPEKGMEMLVCYGCGVTAHHYCYGLKTPYNDVITGLGDKVKMFVCDRCDFAGPDVTQDCGICHQKVGAFKRASNDTFVHITCALFSELYEIESFEDMSIKACPKSEKRVPKQHKHCWFCKKAGNLYNCDANDCENNVHIYCALLNKVTLQIDDEDAEGGWSVRLSKQSSQAPKFVFDLMDPKIKEHLKNIYVRVLKASGKIENNDDEAIEEENHGKKKKGGKNQKKKGGKGQPAKTEHHPVSLSKEDETAFTGVYNDMKKALADATKQTLATSNNKSLHGGQLKFECPNNKSAELYCTCGLPYDDTRFMLGCDSCDNWFHCTCLGLTEEQAQRLSPFFCNKCKDWAHLKQAFIENGTMQLESNIKVVDKSEVVPQDTSRFAINDFLVICLLLEIKVEQMIGQNVDIQTCVNAMLDTAKYVPFNLDGFIGSVLVKYYSAEMLDEMIEIVFSMNEITSMKSIFNKDKHTFNQNEVKKFNERLETLHAIQGLYHDLSSHKTKLSIKIDQLIQKNQWLNSFREVFSTQGARPSLEVIQNLAQQAELVGIDQNLPEKLYLKEAEGRNDSWASGAKKVLSEKAINLKSKIFDVDQGNKGLENLDQVMNSVKEVVKGKPSLDELRELVTRGKEIGGNVSGEVEKLSQILRRTEEVQKALEQRVINFDGVNNKVKELDEVVIFTPELLNFLEYYHRAKTVQLKLRYYGKLAVQHTPASKRKRSEDKMKVEDEDDHHEIKESKDTKALLDEGHRIEDIQVLLREAESLCLDFGSEYKILRDMISHVEEFKKKVAKVSHGVIIDASELRHLAKEAASFNIRFQEAENVKVKNELYVEIKNQVTKFSTPEQLTEMLQKFQNNFNDAKLKTNLENKLAKAREIEEKTRHILSQSTFSKSDVNETVNGILADLKSQKIDIAQKNDLTCIQKSLKWLESLFAFYQKHVSQTSRSSQIEEEKNQNSTEMEIEQANEVDKQSIEYMIQECLLSNDKIMRDIEKHYIAYKNIIKEGQSISHLDERIRKVLETHGTIYWSIEASNVLDRQNIKGEDLHNLYKMAQDFGVSPLNVTFLRFSPLFEECQKWLEEYKKLAESEDFVRLLQNPSDEKLKDEIERLTNSYSQLGVQFSEEFGKLKHANSALEWIRNSKQILENLKSGNKITLDGLQDLISIASQIKISADNALYKEIKELYQNTKKLRDMYNEFADTKKQVREKMKEILREADQKNKKKDMTDLNKIKPQLSKAVQIRKAIQESNFELSKEDFEDLNNEIVRTETWIQAVKEFLEKYPVKDEVAFTGDSWSDITRDLNSLRTEQATLLLQDDVTEQKIHNFEWMFHAYTLINQKDQRLNGIDHWRKLVKLAQKVKGSKLVETGLFTAIQEQIAIYNTISQKVEDIKNQEASLLNSLKSIRVDINVVRKNLKDENYIARLLEDIGQCKVDMPDEKKYLEDLLAKGKKLLEAYEKIENSEDKIPFDTARATLDQFHKLVLKYSEEEKALDGMMDKAKHLQNIIHDWKNNHKNSPKIDIKVAENVANQYKDCKVQLTEVSRVVKEYNDAISVIQKIEENLKNNSSNKVDFHDLLSLTIELEDIKLNVGHRADEAKRRLWLEKIRCFRNFKERVVIPYQSISFTFLKNCLLEGYELLTTKEAIKDLKESVRYTEELVKEAESYLTEIYTIRDPKELENVNYSLYDFIDLREEIIDYKAQLTISKDYYATLEPLGRDLSKKDDHEIIRMVKSKEYLQKEDSRSSRPTLRKQDSGSQKRVTSPNSLLNKRRAGNNKNDDFIYDTEILEEKDLTRGDSDYSSKKLKVDPADAKKNQPPLTLTKASSGKKEKVEEDLRSEAKRKLVLSLKSNPHFVKPGEDFKNAVRLLEMNIFSDFHEDKARYSKKLQSIVDLFGKLKDYKYISKKLMDKSFDFILLQKVMTGNLEELEKTAAENAAKNAKNKQSVQAAAERSSSFESSLSSLLSAGKVEAPKEESSKFKSILSGMPVAKPALVKPQPEPIATKAGPMYLEELSDEEEKQQKTTSKSETSSKNMEEEMGGYFSDEDKPSANKEALLTTPNKSAPPANTTSDYLISESTGKKADRILYDPEMRGGEEEEPIAYDPLKEYNPMAVTSSDILLEHPIYDKGSILRIFKGKLRHNMIQKENFTSIRGCSFLTCNYSEDIRQFPKIPEEIKTSGRVSQNEALDYILKLYSKQMRDSSKIQLIVGWVQVKKEYQDTVLALSQELLDREKVAVIKYSEYASIYLLHPSVIKKDLIKKLDWKVRTPEGQPVLKAPLLFVLYLRGSSLPGMMPASIEPEYVGAPQPLDEADQSPRKLDSEEKGAMSPITDDEHQEDEAGIIVEEQIAEDLGDLLDLIEADPELQGIKHEESSHNAPMMNIELGEQDNGDRKSSSDSIEITQNLMNIVEEMTPIRDDEGETGMEEEEKTEEAKLLFNQEHQIIVDKLQKMSKEELQTFVASATEEEKEKIIKILNSFVEEDPKDQEASAEGTTDPSQKVISPMSQQFGQFPPQMQGIPPHGFGMQGPYGQQPFFQQGMMYAGAGQQQYQQGRPYQQNMGFQQNYYGNQYNNPSPKGNAAGGSTGGSASGNQGRGGYQGYMQSGRGGSQQSGMSGQQQSRGGGGHHRKGGYHGSGSGEGGERSERPRGYHGTGHHHQSSGDRHQGYDSHSGSGGGRASRFSNGPGRQDPQYSGFGGRDQGGYERYTTNPSAQNQGQSQNQGQGQQQQRDY